MPSTFAPENVDFSDHKSWDAYVESLDTPLKFGADATDEERDKAFRVLGEANRYFYPKHVATLASDIRRQIEEGLHPSQSHEQREAAAAVMADFTRFLAANCDLSITEQPAMGFYHGDLTIFNLRFDSELPWSEIDNEIPPFYKGFRIFRIRQSDFERLNPPKSEQGAAPNP